MTPCATYLIYLRAYTSFTVHHQHYTMAIRTILYSIQNFLCIKLAAFSQARVNFHLVSLMLVAKPRPQRAAKTIVKIPLSCDATMEPNCVCVLDLFKLSFSIQNSYSLHLKRTLLHNCRYGGMCIPYMWNEVKHVSLKT